jgi:hypothetical protein
MVAMLLAQLSFSSLSAFAAGVLGYRQLNRLAGTLFYCSLVACCVYSVCAVSSGAPGGIPVRQPGQTPQQTPHGLFDCFVVALVAVCTVSVLCPHWPWCHMRQRGSFAATANPTWTD